MSRETPKSDVLERTETVKKEKKTPPYRVLLMNDDYTPMEFVVAVLIDIFGKSEAEAVHIMLKVHIGGLRPRRGLSLRDRRDQGR